MANVTLTWTWGLHEVDTFNPATDVIDFGWVSADYVTIAEVAGSVVISLPSTEQTYTLQGVTLADLSIANIVANDGSIFAAWTAALADSHPVTGQTVTIAADYGTNTLVNFNPSQDVLDFGTLTAADFALAEVDGSAVIFLPASQQTYILVGVSLDDLTLANIHGTVGSTFTEWNTELALDHDTTAPSPTYHAPTTYTVGWQWNTQTILDFDPVQDKLDFGWLLPQDFTIAEVDGSVIIVLAGNQRTITLEGVSLANLSTDNITAQTSLVTNAWADAIAAATGGSSGSGGTLPVIDDAPDWSASTVYTAGDQVTVGHVVYEAKWWTLGSDPEHDYGPAGSGHVWTKVGYADLIPVAPETPDDFHAATTTDTSVTLTWDAAEIFGVGTISAYDIYQDGTLVGSTSERSFKVAGLSADTSYSFTIVAHAEAGASSASTPVSVTTDAAGSHAADGQVFSPYIDLWLASSQQTDIVQAVADADVSAVTLAFIVGTGTNEIGWAGVGSIASDTLADGTSISGVIADLTANGVDVTISFGGGHAEEPALYFSNATALAAAYQSVIDTYGVTSLDFDIEGAALTNDAASALRNAALVALEAHNPDLSISFTLPVLPTGLTQDDLDLLAAAHAAGVEIDTVNIMVMNYGTENDTGDMGQDAIDAAEATIAQLQTLGIDAKVGITPMVGINDVQSEVFTLQDAQQLVDFADGNDNIASLSMWSLGRDHGDVVGHLTYANSSAAQDDWDFAKIFATV